MGPVGYNVVFSLIIIYDLVLRQHLTKVTLNVTFAFSISQNDNSSRTTRQMIIGLNVEIMSANYSIILPQ
jgi:hypothetical protein